MDRNDIMRAREKLPGLTDLWEHKIARLEIDRERAWNDLRSAPVLGDQVDAEDPAQEASRAIHRMDRSIAFLDRALLHLSDIEKGTHYADDLPLRP